ncbi:MAG TPA: hypothetical protein VMO47_06280, partial [Rhodothermales bacterium]|nr:hypothetical protein [Rhodothermales bacterium]
MRPHSGILIWVLTALILALSTSTSEGDDGYRLWLRYDRIDNQVLLDQYRTSISVIAMRDNTPTLSV